MKQKTEWKIADGERWLAMVDGAVNYAYDADLRWVNFGKKEIFGSPKILKPSKILGDQDERKD